MNSLVNIINNLFLERKYKELINLVETKIDKSKATSQLINILAISKLLSSGLYIKNIIAAIKDFETSFNKKPFNNHNITAFLHFVDINLKLYTTKADTKLKNYCEENFYKSIVFFDKNEILLNKNKQILINNIKIFQKFSDVRKIINFFEKILKNKQDDLKDFCSYIYYLNFLKEWDQIKIYNKTLLINHKITIIPKNKLIKLTYSKNKKTKVGFLSSDIKGKHATTYFLKTVLKNYDKEKYEIILFLNISPKLEDNKTIEFKQLVKRTYNIFQLSNINSINLIRKEKIDIMIDINGLTSSNRISLYKNRVAPIQINWLGYSNTTGLQEIDYIISDPNLIFSNEENLYSEKVLQLKNIWIAHSGFIYQRNKITPPFKNNKYITFGSFNNFEKINEDVIKNWSMILQKNIGSKLILKSSAVHSNDYIIKKFNKFNVSKSIIIQPRIRSHKEHLDLYNKIDVSLDTFPYNGVTTSFESIWMGVPVLTLKGYNYNSRTGSSINKNLGLEELIAKDENDYISKASYLSMNSNKLEEMRNYIFDKALSSPLFDTANYSKNFYETLSVIQQKYLKNKNKVVKF